LQLSNLSRLLRKLWTTSPPSLRMKYQRPLRTS
jgi:hypothetical protein